MEPESGSSKQGVDTLNVSKIQPNMSLDCKESGTDSTANATKNVLGMSRYTNV